MKGVILSLNPNARIVDITHEIRPQDIAAGAFTLLAAYTAFPAGTVHVVVVDPGVGSSRRPLLLLADEQLFVGPDNGIFSYVIDRESQAAVLHPGAVQPRVLHLTNEEYFRQPVSGTFHGRDLFAPVACALVNGVKPETLGSEINDPVRLRPLTVENRQKDKMRALVLHIDRFGNCVTNLTKDDLTQEMIDGGVRLKIKGKTVKKFRRCFADETDDGATLFAIWGSAGFLEIAATNQSAAQLLRARRGDAILVLS
jgi:S-adenosylmethionine hydrolase